ncbi:MAG: hypothetical protein ACI4JT_08445 [Oscillospiraceae bacterium]
MEKADYHGGEAVSRENRRICQSQREKRSRQPISHGNSCEALPIIAKAKLFPAKTAGFFAQRQRENSFPISRNRA